MTDRALDLLRYPIGHARVEDPITLAQRGALIDAIEALPNQMRAVVAELTDAQLDTPYRDGGWTVRQVVHHVPDSHSNCFIRWKLALTEDGPTIKPYLEAHWATLPDSRMAPDNSLLLLDALHTRWVTLSRSMSEADWNRTYTNPETARTYTLAQSLVLYAWHGQHHVAHIDRLRTRLGW